MESSTIKNPEAVFKVLEEVLRQTYGEEDILLIYKYLEDKYGLMRSEFSKNLDLLAKALETVLVKFAPCINSPQKIEPTYCRQKAEHRGTKRFYPA